MYFKDINESGGYSAQSTGTYFQKYSVATRLKATRILNVRSKAKVQTIISFAVRLHLSIIYCKCRNMVDTSLNWNNANTL